MNAEQLYDEMKALHQDSLGWAMRCCENNSHQAEDVLQSVYLKILDRKATFKGQSSFKTWLFAVIKNTAIDSQRKNQRYRNKLTQIKEQKLGVDVDHEPKELAHKKALHLKKMLEKLPVQQQKVMHLVFYQEMTLKECAAVLEISIGSVRQHYDRAKKKLRILFNNSAINT